MYIQLFQYFSSNNLFHANQYGFRAEYSTELALSELVDRIYKDRYEKQLPIAIFIDLSKAFDTIDHIILISKLEHYGVENNELQWFISYMHNRQQYVEIENTKSTTETITTGVPQGSNIGPLLFLIYILTSWIPGFARDPSPGLSPPPSLVPLSPLSYSSLPSTLPPSDYPASLRITAFPRYFLNLEA